MELRDPQSHERLTGRAFFAPSSGPAIHLGNIQLVQLNYGLKVLDIPTARRGVVYPRRRLAYGRAPEFQIRGTQFSTPQIPLLLGAAGNISIGPAQVATTGALFLFNATPGGAYHVGQSQINIQSLKVGSEVLTENFDYFTDPDNGWLWLPVDGGSIDPGALVQTTYDYPTLYLDTYNAWDTLSRDGILTIHAEDEFGPPAKETWVMNVTITCEAMADFGDPSKFRNHTLKALVYGNAQVFKRRQAQAFDELTTESGTVIDLSP